MHLPMESFETGSGWQCAQGDFRITGSYEDIMKQSVRKKIESALEQVIPTDAASDFNQGLIELGAIVCVPNGGPKCEQCPVKEYCIAHAENLTAEIPGKEESKGQKDRRKNCTDLQRR